MNRKMLFFDVDETLMDGRTQKIPDSAVKAITQAHEKGHLIFINTGRTKSIMPKCMEDIPIDGFAYACGSHIEYRDSVLFEKLVSQEDISYIREQVFAHDMQGIFQGPDYCYFGPETVVYLERNQEVKTKTFDFPVKECYDNFKHFLKIYERDYITEKKSIQEEEMKVNKLVTFRQESCDYDSFLEAMGGRYQLIENGGGFTEILPLPYTKASCIDFLMEYFHISEKDCYIFGDSPNDMPMMTHAGISIAMGNGYDSVKEVSDYVTTEIDKDGIYLALKHFNVI